MNGKQREGKKNVSSRKLRATFRGRRVLLLGDVQRSNVLVPPYSPVFFSFFFFRKDETNFANAPSLKTDSYLGSGLWSRNENPVADQQYRFYQINMSDMEAFQNRAFVRQCSLLWQLGEQKERDELAAHTSPCLAVLSSGFVNKANTLLNVANSQLQLKKAIIQ